MGTVGRNQRRGAQWSALIAIADEGRKLDGLGTLDGRSQTLPKLYSLPTGDFTDITTGTSDGTPEYSAGPGYDLVTGLGTPKAAKIVKDLIGAVVTTTNPAVGSTVTTQPTIFTVSFSVPVNPSSLSGSEFTVNSLPANSVTVNTADTTATFTFNLSPVTTQGLQTMQLAADSVTLLGNPVATISEFAGTFRYAAVLIQVSSTNPPVGSAFTLPGGPFTLALNFNTPFDPLSVNTASLVLAGVPGAAVTAVNTSNANTTATFTIAGINSFGALTATVPIGAITDAFGNPNVAPYGATYRVVGTLPYPTPLTPVLPLGSLVYDPVASGGIAAAGDTNNFTLAVDPGQTILACGHALDDDAPTGCPVDRSNQCSGGHSHRPRLRSGGLSQPRGPHDRRDLYDHHQRGRCNDGGLLRPGRPQRRGGSGQQRGPTNSTLATAQNIDSSFLTLGASNSGVARGAVLGGNAAGPPMPAYETTFENGAGGFTINNNEVSGDASGFWHLTTRRGTQPGHSPITSFYYGSEATGNYNTPGFANAGNITSPAIKVPSAGPVTLSFNYVLQTEGNDGYDVASVEVSNDGGATFTTIANSASSTQLPLTNTWAAASFDLSAYAGQTIRVRFDFNTIDSLLNTYEGWYVDDVEVSTPATWNHYYSFTAAANETLSVALKDLTGSGANVLVENGSGKVLASGAAGAANYDSGISNFTLSTAGTYYLVVQGNAAATYNLVVLRDAAFDAQYNDSSDTAQSIDGLGGVLGDIPGAGVPAGNTLTLNWIDSGWWDSTGFHDSTNPNYLAGLAEGVQYRNFTVFDLSAVSQPISAATLNLFNPEYVSPDPTETYTLFDVSTPISMLTTSSSGRTDIFNDLGTGTSYGFQTVSNSDDGQIVSVPLNAAGLSALNDAEGGLAALGGALTTISGPSDQVVFAYSGNPTDVRQLVLQLGPAGLVLDRRDQPDRRPAVPDQHPGRRSQSVRQHPGSGH